MFLMCRLSQHRKTIGARQAGRTQPNPTMQTEEIQPVLGHTAMRNEEYVFIGVWTGTFGS